MKLKIPALFLLFAISVSAQDSKPSGADTATARPRMSDELNKESSSFVPDPDSLDPLPVKKENLKEDEEPILEDIRQIINAPSKKKKAAVKATKPTTSKKSANKSKVAARKSKNRKSVLRKNLSDDDADLALETKFNKLYKTYNIDPTSAESWNTVLKGTRSETYKIQKKDTLWSISRTLFGDPNFWPKLWSVNRKGILNPHIIKPGYSVVFYPGSTDQSPSVDFAENSTIKESSGNSEVIKPERKAAEIPDSLPLSRNERYFLPPKLLKIKLAPEVELVENYSSNILLADVEIESEAEISIDEHVKGICGGEHVLQTSDIKSQEGKLKVYEKLESFNSDAGEIFPYRHVGDAIITGPKKIKITNCSSVMSKDLVFISPSLVDSFRTAKMTNQETPTLIGGPNIGTQLLFSNHQMTYINLGSHNVEVGQTVKVKSQLTDMPSGSIRIVDKFGSFAIGIVTETVDLIEQGDEIILK